MRHCRAARSVVRHGRRWHRPFGARDRESLGRRVPNPHAAATQGRRCRRRNRAPPPSSGGRPLLSCHCAARSARSARRPVREDSRGRGRGAAGLDRAFHPWAWRSCTPGHRKRGGKTGPPRPVPGIRGPSAAELTCRPTPATRLASRTNRSRGLNPKNGNSGRRAPGANTWCPPRVYRAKRRR